MTALDIIKAALRMLGAGQSGYTLTTAEDADALQKLNGLLNLLSAERLLVETIVEETGFVMTLGDSTYTIGATGNIVTTRPTLIVSAYYRDSSNRDYHLDIVSRERWNNIGLKTISTRPSWLYYQPTMPNGLITLAPVPDAAYTLFLNSLKPLASFANTGVTVALAPEYQIAIETNLALALAPEYNHLQVNPILAQQARDSLNVIRALRLVNDMVTLTVASELMGRSGTDHSIIQSGG